MRTLKHPHSRLERMEASKQHERPKAGTKGPRIREVLEDAETKQQLIRVKNFGEVDL